MKNKNFRNALLLLLVTGVILYFSLKDDFRTVLNEILSINIFWLVIGVLLLLGYWFLEAVILHKLSQNFKKNYSFYKAFRVQVICQFFSAVTPFASGGQPFQLYAMKKDKFTYGEATSIVVQQFILYQIALVLIGIFALIYNRLFNLYPKVEILQNLVALGFVINAFVIVFLILLAYSKKFDRFIFKFGINFLYFIKVVKDKGSTIERWNKKIEDFTEGAKILTKNKKEFIYMIIISIFSLISLYLTPCVILYGMGDYNSVTPIVTIVSSAYVMLVGSFVPIPGGTGGIEFGFASFFGNFIKGPILPALLLVWRFITYYMVVIFGSIFVNLKGKEEKCE